MIVIKRGESKKWWLTKREHPTYNRPPTTEIASWKAPNTPSPTPQYDIIRGVSTILVRE